MEKETRELFNVLLKEIGSVREDVRNVKGEIRSVREEVGNVKRELKTVKE